MVRNLLIILLPVCLLSCVNSKQLSYFQDLSDTSRKHLVEMAPFEPLRLQADDQVRVNINSISPEAGQFFNLMMGTPTSGVGGGSAMPGQGSQNNYQINQEGVIILPVLGEIQAAGLTTEELRLKIKELLKDYLKEPVVNVTLTNFRVTVIGEVGGPKIVPVVGERINLLEALGAAGDMTVYGKRYNVKVVRRTGDKLDIASVNFNNSKAIGSPYFQLKPNDVVYVEPNRSKGFSTEGWVFLLPLITTLLWLVQFLVQVL
jgi:polysaccharide export outer membrane protein